MKNESIKTYNTDIYVRLSREDGDKIESDSIVNQKELIKNFLKNKPEFKLHQIRVDDGFTGVDFQRPAFIEMLADIKAGKVNCVIVKDLSRFGRNYIEAGKYITNIFPFLDVRFIAINDNFDTADINNSSELIFFHFKNLINDAYCADISVKTRSQLEVKRTNGDFTGAYTCYGYLKSPENKNKLIVDESVKNVINDIFSWKINGMSALRIAEKLNSMGILPPMEHKKELGINYHSPLRKKIKAEWNTNSVLRILQNRIYTGTLEQSKTTTPNYKIKTRIYKNPDEWVVTKNNHEPIIDEKTFNDVQELMCEDTRVAPKNEQLYLFSGFLKCGVCGGNVTRKTVPIKEKSYTYFICLNHKNGCNCTNKMNFKEQSLEKTVLKTLNLRYKAFLDMQGMIDYVRSLPLHTVEIEKIENQIVKYKNSIENDNAMLLDDLKKNLIDEKDYKSIKQIYADRIETSEKAVKNLQKEINVISSGNKSTFSIYENIANNGSFTELSRKIIVSLIDKIYLNGKNDISIVFKFDEDASLMENYISKLPKETGVC